MSHGHDDHGHGNEPAASHGPATIPPEPVERSISPAREEYEKPYPGPGIAWPFVWLGVAVLFLWSTSRWHAEVAPASGHEEPAGETHAR
jgi:hypothetical protein